MSIEARKSLIAITVFIAIAAAIGYGLSLISDLEWISGACLALIAFLLMGAWVYEDGEMPGGLEHDPVAWKSGESQRSIKLNNSANYSIALILLLIVLWSEFST